MSDDLKNQENNSITSQMDKIPINKNIQKDENLSDTKAYNADDLKIALNQQNNSKQFSKNKSKTAAKKERSKNKSKQNVFLFRTVWIVMVILVSIVASRYILLGVNDMLGISRDERTVSIEIPKDASVNDISKILAQSHVIDNPDFFKLYSFFTNSYKTFTHGSFDIKTNMDYENIITYLQSNTNRKDIVNATFTEGMNVTECASLLEEKGVCKYDDFLNTCKSNNFDAKYDFIKNMSNPNLRYYKLEGYLFPDTYQFYKDENPDDTVDKLLSNYKDKITDKTKIDGYDKKTSITKIVEDKNLNMDTILIIASIIQAEAADKDDMYNVSSVIYNRLKTLETNGINENNEYGLDFLRMDSTIYYPYRNKNDIPSNTLNSFKSTYDTYNNKGLPSGPICNPGTDAIYAAINPNNTNYYYFCHSKNGDAYYARTKAGHEENLQAAGLK